MLILGQNMFEIGWQTKNGGSNGRKTKEGRLVVLDRQVFINDKADYVAIIYFM